MLFANDIALALLTLTESCRLTGYKVLDFPPKMLPQILTVSPAVTFSLPSPVFGPSNITCILYQMTS